MTEQEFSDRIKLILSCAPDMKRAIAIEYGLPESTIQRWADGITFPLPGIRESIYRWALHNAGERSYEDLDVPEDR